MCRQRVFFWLLIFSTSPAFAARVVIQNPCGGNTWLDTIVTSATGRSIGAVTIEAFDAHKTVYVGNAIGIHSIRGSVTGDRALEVLSDREMRAYGWCYSVNGVQPDDYPNDILVKDDSEIILWFFGFAHYRDGKWISYCTPTQMTRPALICGH